MHGALLMAHQHMAQRILLEQLVIDGKDGAARITENDVDALIHQSPDHHLRAVHLFVCHDPIFPPGCFAFPPDLAVSGAVVKLKLPESWLYCAAQCRARPHKLATHFGPVNGSCEYLTRFSAIFFPLMSQ